MNHENARRREIGLQRRERTRQKLLEAAARVVAERGEKKATIDDFIQAAGVARGTFYNHYTTRNELLEDLWKQIGQDPFREIQGACEKLADPAERLTSQARLVLDCAKSNPAWGWLVYALSVDSETVNDDLLSYPRPDLIAGMREGRLSVDDLSAANNLIVGAVRTTLRAVLDEPRQSGSPESLCVMLLKAVGLPDVEAREISGRPLPTLRQPLQENDEARIATVSTPA